MSELFYDDLLKDEAVKRMEEYLLKEKLTGEVKDTFNKDIDSIYERIDLEELEHYMGFFSSETIFDFSNDKEIYFLDINLMKHNEMRMLEDLYKYNEEKYLSSNMPFYVSLDNLLNNQYVELKT